MVDGSFFLKRYMKCVQSAKTHSPKTVAKNMYTILLKNDELFEHIDGLKSTCDRPK